jgi:hypothetical protein
LPLGAGFGFLRLRLCSRRGRRLLGLRGGSGLLRSGGGFGRLRHCRPLLCWSRSFGCCATTILLSHCSFVAGLRRGWGRWLRLRPRLRSRPRLLRRCGCRRWRSLDPRRRLSGSGSCCRWGLRRLTFGRRRRHVWRHSLSRSRKDRRGCLLRPTIGPWLCGVGAGGRSRSRSRRGRRGCLLRRLTFGSRRWNVGSRSLWRHLFSGRRLGRRLSATAVGQA